MPQASVDARAARTGPQTTAIITPAETVYIEGDTTPMSTNAPPSAAHVIHVHLNARQGVIKAIPLYRPAPCHVRGQANGQVEQPTQAVDHGSVWFAELMWKARAGLDRILPADTGLRVGIGVFSLWLVGCVMVYTSPTLGSRTSRAGDTFEVNHAYGHLFAAAFQSLVVTGLLSFFLLIIYAASSSGDS
jgi:hypothetical protein